MKTLYETLTEAGVETDSHCSDLYFPATPESRAILGRFPVERANATCFTPWDGSQGLWFDVPFAFTPYWKAATKLPA